ncbi:MAG: formate C-acetyltransferase/glycerol dehydratase family glycyl radical enzyme, partial [Bacteroidales bacterium]|nr:formate C-acetyltransferase/glycerol dehydratase family glycyl radical enzyme [Bacteroidales bacterium]
SREKVSFKVSEETKKAYQETIIPYWTGNSNRDKMVAELPQEWHNAYEAGVFTEFQEQRAPGHTVCGDKIYYKGMLEIIDDIDKTIRDLDFFTDPNAFEKRNELKAMRIAAQAIIDFALRHAEALYAIAQSEQDPKRKSELHHMAQVCKNVPAHAPQTLHEALQYYWFVHLGVITEVNPWDSFNPGRLDQHLYPFYIQDLANGRLTKEEAKELMHCFWIKFNNHPAPPKTGVTAQESNTYTDFCNINLGGMKPDGSDGVNEMTFLLLDVIEEMRLLQPSSNIQVSKKNPDSFIHRTLHILKTGFGQPSVFNADAVCQELLRQGKSLIDARKGGTSGCVEAGAFGHEAYILTGYFNLPKILEITLYNGIDPRTGKKIGVTSGDPRSFNSMDELLQAFNKQLIYFANIKIKGNNLIESLFMNNIPVPFLSLLIDDCIANGKDYMCGGARYNTNYIQGVGIGTLSDCFSAIQYQVFDKENISMDKFIDALTKNFTGYEELRYQLVYKTPKYGNDNDDADQFARTIFELYYHAMDGHMSPRGATSHINLLPTTCHIYFGSVIGALPDGRKSGEALSEGISPVQGVDTHSPVAVIQSAAKLDHLRTGGTLLNQKLTPSFFDTPESIDKLCKLIRTYFLMDGHHIQFNVVSAETLKEAKKHPERYRDLIVRVAGYSDYFNDLIEPLQDEIINRTEHAEF